MIMRGSVDVLDDMIIDLRQHNPLVELLPESQAIYHGWTTAERGYDVEVSLALIYNGSTPHRGVTQRDYRIQVTVKASFAWMEEQDRIGNYGIPSLMEIMDKVADRLDRMDGMREVSRGNEGGPAPMRIDGNRRAIMVDWRCDGYYIND